MKSSILRPVIVLALLLCASLSTRAHVGADIPWITYEAEDMKTTGAVLGPEYGPYLVTTESSGQKCVKLTAAGQFVEFTAQADANTIVVRYSLPDAEEGGGINSTLNLSVNGKAVKTLAITSHYSWLYGNYPFSNRPDNGKPRNFYNEVRLNHVSISRGDIVRLQKPDDAAPYCIIDLMDLESVAPLTAPAHSLSVMDFGATGKGDTDDTEAVRKAVAQAAKNGKTVWVPEGDYKVTGDIVVPSNVTIQGAGMWYTTFEGDPEVYRHADRRVRFTLTGSNVHLADFAIVGKLNYRNDNEQNDGIFGAHAQDSSVSRIWVEHTKVGMWFYVCSNVTVEGCRMRNTLADGINLCVDTRKFVVQNCTTRGTGDDCFAMWPTASDQGFVQEADFPGENVFRHCTGELPFLANGGAIYGGHDNRMEDCLFKDISPGCGILISSTFPVSDETKSIENNFSGTTVVTGCELIGCGGYDHDWAWRAAFQLCLDRRSISNVQISDITIKDSFSDALSVVAPGSNHGQGTLSNVRLDKVNISKYGLGKESSHALWIRNDALGSLKLADSKIDDVLNDSTSFNIVRE